MDLIRVLKNFNVLNCILIIVFLVFLFGFLLPRVDSDVVYVPALIKKKPVEKNPNESLKTQSPPPQEYRDIADQNIFHPERIIPPEKKPEALLPKPEFVLFGTLITPNLKVAYLEDKKAPVSTPGRGQRQTALMIGESLSGFKLKEIMTDKVVMTRGDETLQVFLQEPGSSKARGTTPGPKSPVPAPRPAVPLPDISPPNLPFPPPESIGPSSPARVQRPLPPGRMPRIPSPSEMPIPPMPPPMPGS
ncbi:MAG: hypothetical protein ABSE95_01725 [Thermodesulfobacteriota bacterium]